MEFNGSIHKISMMSKKEAGVEGTERDYLQITLLVPVNKARDLTEFAKHFHNTSKFIIESLQTDLEM